MANLSSGQRGRSSCIQNVSPREENLSTGTDALESTGMCVVFCTWRWALQLENDDIGIALKSLSASGMDTLFSISTQFTAIDIAWSASADHGLVFYCPAMDLDLYSFLCKNLRIGLIKLMILKFLFTFRDLTIFNDFRVQNLARK